MFSIHSVAQEKQLRSFKERSCTDIWVIFPTNLPRFISPLIFFFIIILFLSFFVFISLELHGMMVYAFWE